MDTLQVTASFLDNLGVAGNDKAAKLLFDQFLNGPANASSQLTVVEQAKLDQMLAKLTSFYGWNDHTPFYKLASQNCSDMLILTEWKSKGAYKFYDAWQTATDYGACCLITPYLDFENPETRNRPASTYTGADYNSIPTGNTRNGIKNGLEIMLDVESYDYAYFPRYLKNKT
jgi:hypothetical protein